MGAMMEREQRKAIIKIRVTEAEQAAWHAKAEAAGLSMSELIRRAVDRVKTWTASNSAIERERTRELAKVGNNLNQIARWANTYKGAADASQVICHLLAIEQLLDPSYAIRPVSSDATPSPRQEADNAH